MSLIIIIIIIIINIASIYCDFNVIVALAVLASLKLQPFAPINVKPGGGRRAWGEDLIVFVVPGVGYLTDLVLLGEGIFEPFFARRGDI